MPTTLSMAAKSRESLTSEDKVSQRLAPPSVEVQKEWAQVHLLRGENHVATLLTVGNAKPSEPVAAKTGTWM